MKSVGKTDIPILSCQNISFPQHFILKIRWKIQDYDPSQNITGDHDPFFKTCIR